MIALPENFCYVSDRDSDGFELLWKGLVWTHCTLMTCPTCGILIYY